MQVSRPKLSGVPRLLTRLPRSSPSLGSTSANRCGFCLFLILQHVDERFGDGVTGENKGVPRVSDEFDMSIDNPT